MNVLTGHIQLSSNEPLHCPLLLDIFADCGEHLIPLQNVLSLCCPELLWFLNTLLVHEIIVWKDKIGAVNSKH